MATLLFDGVQHRLSSLSDDGEVVGAWIAYNNVDRHATISHVRNQTYVVRDRSTPRRHTPNANGPYGLHGIIRFNVAGHPGVGVHSGRANAAQTPGPAHMTMGCIRTTDEAMGFLSEYMRDSPLRTIRVINNSAPAARAATRRHHQRHLRGGHHG